MIVDTLDGPTKDWLNVEVVNNGQFRATVTRIYIRTSDISWTSPELECLNAETNRFEPCIDAVRIEPQDSASFRLALNTDSYTRHVVCDDVNRDGLAYKVQTRGPGGHDGRAWNKILCA